MTQLCSDERMQALIAAVASGDQSALDHVDEILAAFPDDPRLHFMRGSMLIGLGRLIDAHQALTRAVEMAPDFSIARFQLGFFQLTSGEVDSALETWGRLDRLPDDHYLRKFVTGLRCLVRDDFSGTIEHLEAGIAVNQENFPLNNDMQLIINQCAPLIQEDSGAVEGDTVSETSFLLGQRGSLTTKH